MYKWESILEVYNDAHTFGLKSADSKAVNNSNLAISWLEATFPELVRQAGDGGQLYTVRAQPFVLLDASVSLQVILVPSFISICFTLVLSYVMSVSSFH